MSDEALDPRETLLHPRHRQRILGHDAERKQFEHAFEAGTPHHAWLISGPAGIGKASLSYALAKLVLSAGADPARTASWLAVRSHPDFHVLELAVVDAKTGRLKSEISVDDVHAFVGSFGRTSGQGGWRVGLVDSADDLNREGANALLKLVEEPPPRSLIFIVNHEPGRLLRTLASRCRRLPLEPLTADLVEEVLLALPVEQKANDESLRNAAALSRGSPGRALELLESAGAQAFRAMIAAPRIDPVLRSNIGGFFSNRATLNADYHVFIDLAIGWAADRALNQPASRAGLAFAELSGELSQRRREVEGYNLDRRTAVLEALTSIGNALKAA